MTMSPSRSEARRFGRPRCARGQWKLEGGARCKAVTFDLERPEIALVDIEHPDDVRRQGEDDVGLGRFRSGMSEEAPYERQIAQSRNPL